MDWVDDAIKEFGWEGCGGTLIRAIQMGQYLQKESEYYDEKDNIIAALTYDIFKDIAYKKLDLTDMILEDVIEEIDSVAWNCRDIDNIDEIEAELIEEFGEPEESEEE